MKTFLAWMKAHKIIAGIACLILIIIPILVKTNLSKSDANQVTSPIQKGDIIEGVYGIGTVMANRSFQLQIGVTSVIEKMFVKEGDHVKKGQPLMVIDTITSRAPFDGVITSLPYKVGELVYMQFPILTLTDLA